MNVRHLYYSIFQVVDDLNDQSNSKHQQIIQLVKNQLEICKTINGYITPDSKTATGTSHLPQFTLDLVKGRSPRTKNRSDSWGQLECEAGCCPFLFYDQLRWAALENFKDVCVLSDVLVTLHLCERRTFRYMSHIVHDVQQQYLMKQARNNMEAIRHTSFLISSRNFGLEVSEKVVMLTMEKKKGYAMVRNGCICETNRLKYGKGCSP